MEHMIGLTDTAYLGRVGEVELGASALAGVYYLVIYMLGFGFSVGAQVLMARRNGEGEYKRIGEVFTQGRLTIHQDIRPVLTIQENSAIILYHDSRQTGQHVVDIPLALGDRGIQPISHLPRFHLYRRELSHDHHFL